MSLQIALYQPEIPPNTGNIIRLCANTGVRLHLIHPLGFPMEDKKLRRAGLDYHEFASIQHHDTWEHFQQMTSGKKIWACSTKGKICYASAEYQQEDILLFGPETRGLPLSIRDALPSTQCIRIPMLPHSRSLNLSNAVAVVLFEAWRQLNFAFT